MSEHQLHILLVEDNPGDALLVQEMLADAEADSFYVRRADSLLGALDLLADNDFDAIVLDLNLPDSSGFETFSAMQSHAPGTPVVLLTGHDDDGMALSAVEAGAQDYLVKDRLDEESLVRALRYAVVRQQGRPRPAAEQESANGRLIGVLGSKGGVGTTTVACHLAVQLQQATGATVLLVDLDVDGGAAGFLMQAATPYTALDAAENVHRLDERLWRTLVRTGKDGVDVLPSPALRAQAALPPAGRFRHVLRFARKVYRWVVVDLGRLGQLAGTLLPDLDELLVVTTGDLMAVHDTGRLLECLPSLGLPAEKTSIIHNQGSRWSAGAKLLKAVISLPPRSVLPTCDNELAAAYTKGQLLGAETDFGRELGRLAAAVAGVDGPPEADHGFSFKKLNWFGGRAAAPAEHS